MTLLYLSAFAVLGAFARYAQSLLVQRLLGRSFPFATLSINVLGSVLMGVLFFGATPLLHLSPAMRTAVLGGGLGSYTTFSTFAMESLTLLDNGQTAKAVTYMLASALLGLAGVAAGAYLSMQLGAPA